VVRERVIREMRLVEVGEEREDPVENGNSHADEKAPDNGCDAYDDLEPGASGETADVLFSIDISVVHVKLGVVTTKAIIAKAVLAFKRQF